MRWYIETISPLGRITPAVFHDDPPRTEGKGNNVRLKLLHGTGPRVRPGSLREINEGHHHLTLDQLAHVYSPDGKFRNT